VKDGKCYCPKGTELKQVGPNAYRCVPIPPPPPECIGGRIDDGKCVCPKGTVRQTTGKNKFVCVKAPNLQGTVPR
jgi:hypothetical protein